MPSIREASHAGSWYSKKPSTLSRELDDWLSQVPSQVYALSQCTKDSSGEPQPERDAQAYTPPIPGARVIIAPHAGYSYSGPAAAWAYKSLDLSNCKRIFLLGPSHAWYLNDCAISSHTYYETPLGNFTLDRDTIKELDQTGKFRKWIPGKETLEHSLEMHLPYLYKMCSRTFESEDKFPLLIPVLVGNVEPPQTPASRVSSPASRKSKDETAYGEVFLPYLKDPTSIFVISSDFCHWGERFSYQSHMPEEVDQRAMTAIETGSHQAFADDIFETQNTVCGRHPIGVMMASLELYRKEKELEEGKGVFRFLRYERSGEISTKYDSSVSYCSAIAIL